MCVKNDSCSSKPSFEKAEDNETETGSSKGSCRPWSPGREQDRIPENKVKIRDHYSSSIGGRGSCRRSIVARMCHLVESVCEAEWGSVVSTFQTEFELGDAITPLLIQSQLDDGERSKVLNAQPNLRTLPSRSNGPVIRVTEHIEWS